MVCSENNAAIFVDLNDVLNLPDNENWRLAVHIGTFLADLLENFRQEQIPTDPSLLLAFMNTRPDRSVKWHNQCQGAAREHGFALYWSLPGESTGDLLFQYAQTLQNDMLTAEIFVVCGDGDIIPAIDALRWNGDQRQVCVLSFSTRRHRYLPVVASGVVDLETITPLTYQLSQI